MEVIFEIVNRAGRTLERHKASGARLSIGRAFDNELILADETVSPHHAALETDERGEPVLIDLDSLNGIRSQRHDRIDGAASLRSGDIYSFGRARVRIYAAAHPVAATVRVGGMDWLINRLGSAAALSVILGLVASVAITEQWLNTYTQTRWQEMGIGLIGVMAAGLLIATFWAIVGRIAKHEGRFQTQLALVMLYLLLEGAIVTGYEWLLFNTLSVGVSTTVGLLASFLLLSGVLWVCLHIATNQPSAQRWKFAVSIAGILLCLSMYPKLLKQTGFSGSPDYINEVKPPAARIAGGDPVERFLEHAAALFAETAHDDDASQNARSTK